MLQIFHDGEGDSANTMSAVTFDFEDITEILTTPAPEYNAERATYADDFSKRMRKDKQWFGGLSCKSDVIDLVRGGWESGATRSSEVSVALEGTIASVEAIRRRPRWGEDGEDISVERALNGEWDTAFLDMPRVRTNGSKIVTIAGSVGGDCMRGSDELFWNGLQLMVVSDMLEAAGYQTEVWGINLCRQGGVRRTLIAARAKIAGEPMRLDTMASIFAHAAVFRTFFFSAMARAATPINHGFGYPDMSTGSMTTNLRQAHRLGWMPSIDVVMGDAYSRDTAIKNIAATLKFVTE